MPHDLPKAYEPGAIEKRWADYWIQEKLFEVKTPAPGAAPQPVFTLLTPPPNVTGRLHMGHMLNHTEMDIVCRWYRMRGFLTLWIPGTDHAGIATQMMVERQLQSEGKKRTDLGREAFIKRVWEWKEHYGGAILEQMKRIGDSVDWSREFFTMDERLSRAVREVFVRLHEDGLIYRGRYIVNWCPRCMTAISDLEVVHEDSPGKLYEVRYPVVGSNEFLTVATTRPETMLGDTAVAVNPADERYQHLHGKSVRLPLMEREIPIITDEVANPEFGTGVVKITPAHDPNDFAAGLRHNLPQVDVIDETGHINENGGKYAGLDRYEARAKVLEDLEAQGLLAGTKDYVVPLGRCQRCKTVIEPRLSTQWFIKIQPLADRAIEAVETGEITFVPENYTKTYFEWMRNIRDWCISRQLWWGHRIPAWHCLDCKEITVARETPAKCPKCGSAKLEQDNDVLDTWFSSALLPFTTLGWPDQTPDLKAFYPTSLLLTAFDILFFWVARMIMMGCWFMKGHQQDAGIKQASSWGERKDDSVPYREVYIHSLVRDAERQKMSKTKGNVIDPLEVVDKFGTDAVRFALAIMAAPGTDIAFSDSRAESYRAFANKIWNAARFLFMNVDRAQQDGLWSLADFQKSGARGAQVEGFSTDTLGDRWILSRLNRVAGEVNEALKTYRFHEASHVVYHFFWGEFCDWYIEIVKLRLTPAADANKAAARAAFSNLLTVFEAALRLLHPFMPFLTEELWHAVYDGKPPLKSIALAAYPAPDPKAINDAAETDMAILQDLIVSVRNIRAELKVETRLKTPVRVFADAHVRKLFEENRNSIERLANVEGMEFVAESLAKAAGARSTARFDVAVVYERKIDKAAERERLRKELEKLEKEAANSERQLGNENFLSKAPANVVDGLKKRREELKVLTEKARAALDQLGSG